MNIEQLVSGVIQHALRQHEDSEWAIVVEGMRRDEIAAVIRADGAKTRKQAIRAIRYHLELIKLRVEQPELVPA